MTHDTEFPATNTDSTVPPAQRIKVQLEGTTQGVGYRPFAYRLAHNLRLGGYVANTPQGLTVEVEGTASATKRFVERLERDGPQTASVRRRVVQRTPTRGETLFRIVPSTTAGKRRMSVPPDLATCPDCLRELLCATDRRHRYPFISCTQCGPRYSILLDSPFDRANTTMAQFTLCPRCQAEFDDPQDRRFHAQTSGCAECGPKLAFFDRAGDAIAEKEEALKEAAELIRNGGVLALKGLGGYQLIADACSPAPVRRLRSRKHRPHKPFAVMVANVEMARSCCEVSLLEETLLTGSAAPIVLLRRSGLGQVTTEAAPDNPWLGIMLATTPLHHLLLNDLGYPVIATSANHGGEPMAIGEPEVFERLAGIADGYLTHDRPIARVVDDSVVRVIGGEETVLRNARGYAPLTLTASSPSRATIVALGGHQKVAPALAVDDLIVLGAHIGDLGRPRTREIFHSRVSELTRLAGIDVDAVTCDAHPDYHSTRHAGSLGYEVMAVQHHVAHVMAAMTEHALTGPVLGVAWDGSGYGDDGGWWGGEFLIIDDEGARRVAHLRPFPLPGGERAVREPRRAALGLLYAAFGSAGLELPLPVVQGLSRMERRVLTRMLERGLNTPMTTSAGRLFDATAALLGLCQTVSFEGQAAMVLEHLQETSDRPDPLEFPLVERNGVPDLLDWQPMLERVLADLDSAETPAFIAARFHASLAAAIVRIARHFAIDHVVLTGGCFQNRTLAEASIHGLRQAGFEPYWPRRVPPNDGGLAVGQIAWARRQFERRAG